LIFLEEGLLLGKRMAARGSGEHRVVAAGAREQDGERDRKKHEDDGRVGGQLGEQIGRAAWAEGGLRSLAAEGSGEIGRLALLEQDDADEEERDDNVQDNEKDDHRDSFEPLGTGVF